MGCKNLKSVEFSEGLEEICLGAFLDSGLENVSFPRSLRVLRQAAFAKCERLRTVVLNEGLETLGTDEYSENGEIRHGVFGYSAVESVSFPSTLKRIEYSAFEGCESLRSVFLPEGLTHIGKRCFFRGGLEEIVFPASVRDVCPRAFQQCKQLRKVVLNAGLQTLGAKEQANENEEEGYVFAGSGLRSVSLPSTLKSVPQNTFWECKSLRSVQFAEGLEYIGLSAF